MSKKTKTNLAGAFAGLVLAGALAAGPLLLAGQAARADTKGDMRGQGTIVVSGEGEAALVPDMALLSLGVNTMAPAAGEALSANSTAMSAVLAALKARGIEDRDLQTSGLQINPQYRYPDQAADGTTPAPQLIGYQVVNTLSVRLRDVTKVGEVIDQAVGLGMNQSTGITFLSSDSAKAEDEARKAAVAKARAKAETLAAAAGVTLGRLIELSESPGSVQPVPMMDAMVMKSAAPATPVAIGESIIRVQVNMTFAIAKRDGG